ncbi:metallophosphoesterase family protein [Anaerovorax odorimutans]|uniref:metallophosphoesterase family protein n=1 Tax=Anaerovorax odorimutans TaxID=109327 RepID=UPI0004160FB9|nr:metallophosphoesterase [Anaerovorax odorimutans]
MRLLVISDTHGKIESAVKIYKELKNIDMIIHLGDLASDAKLLENILGADIISVKGNMDGDYSMNGGKILKTPYGNIYLAHGHMENVKFSPQTILYKSLEMGCKAAFYGHTHIPYFNQTESVFLLNPGSLSLPKGGRAGSYAIVNITESSFDAEIKFVDNIIEKDKKQKTKFESGYLKNLLNNSDRF